MTHILIYGLSTTTVILCHKSFTTSGPGRQLQLLSCCILTLYYVSKYRTNARWASVTLSHPRLLSLSCYVAQHSALLH